MRILRQLRSFASALLHRGRVDDEFRSEIDFHVSAYADDLVRQGIPRAEAERRARVEFGSVSRVREECRAARGVALLDDLWGDLRYAARMMRRSPGFAAVAILSLGFGLGANTAIFTLVDTVMLKSLPVKNADRLFFVDNSGGKSGGGNGPPYPCFEIMRDHNQYFSGLAAFSGERFKVTIDGAAESIGGQYVSGSYFELLGVQAAYGRVLTPADDSIVGSGGPEGGVAVISYGLWKRRFGMSPAVLGKKIQVGTNWVTIVGVTRPEFFGLQVGLPTDLTIPMMLTTNNLRSKSSMVVQCSGTVEGWRDARTGTRRTGPAFSAVHGGAWRRTWLCNEKVLQPRGAGSGGERPGGTAAQILQAAADRDDGGGAGAVDRLRQRRKPSAGPGKRPAERDRDAPGDWGEPRAAVPTDAHGGAAVSGGGCDSRDRIRQMGAWNAGGNVRGSARPHRARSRTSTRASLDLRWR